MRLAATLPDAAVAPDPRPATALVPDPDLLAAALRTTDFDRDVELVAQAEAERDAEWAYGAAAEVLQHRRTHRCRIGCVLDLLAAGRAEELQQTLPVPDLAELVEVLLAALGATLVAAGGVGWRHRSGEPLTLVRMRWLPVDLRTQVARACREPAGVAPLRYWLTGLGVGNAVLTGQPEPWRPPLRLGPGFRTEPARVDGLLLPEELFLLAYSPTGHRRLAATDVFEASIAAAALAELRLRGRVRLAETDAATVVVTDATPTGDRLLDRVLDQVAAAGEQPAYQWLRQLGREVSGAVADRVLGPTRGLDGDQVQAVTARARAGIAEALQSEDLAGRDLVLGALLWGCELTAPVLGRTAVGSRFWLGRVAARDRLAVAIRTVIGLHLPGYGGGTGSGF